MSLIKRHLEKLADTAATAAVDAVRNDPYLTPALLEELRCAIEDSVWGFVIDGPKEPRTRKPRRQLAMPTAAETLAELVRDGREADGGDPVILDALEAAR